MAKTITVAFAALLALASCDNMDVNDTTRSAAVGAVAGGATNYVIGEDVVDGAVAGAVAGVAVELTQ